MRVAAVRLAILVTAVLVSLASWSQTPTRSLITTAVDESQLRVLQGNTHPLARAEFDQGAAPADLPMNRMLLVLKRGDEQQTALRTLIDDQQDKASANYHKWITPEVFGKQFGPSDLDIQQVTFWLQSHGFKLAQVSKGRTVIEFSGTAAQVQEAFHTSIHQYSVAGTKRWANASDPQIPQALTPVVAGVFSLHNFPKRPQINISKEQFTAKYLPNGKSEFTSSNGIHALTPADYNIIYNIPAPTNTPPATIAILGRSNINLQDVTTFHSLMADSASFPQIVINGADPGDLGGGEEAEAVLDTTWSGAVSAGAGITLVVSASTNTTDGVALSELYVVDNNLADVMSESFGDCEANHTAAGATAVSSLAQQAAAEGITYLVSSGDSGAAGCDDPNLGAPATGPFSVNILASTPYTVAVGGTMFYENGQDSSYWNPKNTFNFTSAISYIPEKAWNESSSSSIWAGSGGASTYFSKPNWQAGFGDSARDIPDVSLTAAAHDPYLLCLDSSCNLNSQGQFFFAGVGGTSASAPAFAGIMARVVQQTGSRQGLANYVLYKLAAAEVFSQCNGSVHGGLTGTCVFNDVTLGNISVPGDSDYGTSTAKYQTSAGFDLATGLGSVNVSNLLNAWNTASFNATTTTASITPLNAVHGAAMNVNVSVTSHSGTPAGSVWLQRTGQTGVVGDSTQAIFTLDASGTVATPTHILPGGTYQLAAHYAGDANYAASDSVPLSVNIQPETSISTLSLLLRDSSGNLVPFSNIQYGLPFIMKAHVAGNSGYGTPTSYVDFSGSSYVYGSAFLDKNGDGSAMAATNFVPGSYSAHAHYYGDLSFNGSTSSSASFTVTQASTTISLNSFPATQGTNLTAFFTVDGSTPLAGNPPTGSVNFYNGSSLLGSSPITVFFNGTQQVSATFSASQLPNGQYSMTASYAGDTNYLPSVSAPNSVTLQPDFSLSPATNLLTIAIPGQHAELDVTTSFYDGFAGTVTFTCSGMPSETTCSSTPLTAPGTAAITVNTTAPVTRKAELFRAPFYLVPFASSVAGMFLLGLPSRRRRSAGVFFVLLLAALGATTSCGGGSTSTPAPAIRTDPGTPSGAYTVTVTATSGTLSHSFLITLTVQ